MNKTTCLIIILITNYYLNATIVLANGGTWNRLGDSIVLARYAAVGFSIGSKGYIGTGADAGAGTKYKDFWQWDQATGT